MAKSASGEPFTDTALGVVLNNTALGTAANAWLQIIADNLNLGYNELDINIRMMNAYGEYQSRNFSESNPGGISVGAIKTMHDQVFNTIGLPWFTFGGYMMPSNVWCSGCKK